MLARKHLITCKRASAYCSLKADNSSFWSLSIDVDPVHRGECEGKLCNRLKFLLCIAAEPVAQGFLLLFGVTREAPNLRD